MGWQNFRRFFKFDPGESSKIRFWDDVRCGDRALKEVFLGLYIIARLKEASIADNVERSNGSIQWNIQFTLLIHDWEVEELASFYRYIYACKLREGGGGGGGKISFGGCLRARVFLRLSLLIELSRLVGLFLFLGREFGNPGLLLEWRFLFGRRFVVRSLHWIILGGGAWLW
jgi:hypothetical protein